MTNSLKQDDVEELKIEEMVPEDKEEKFDKEEYDKLKGMKRTRNSI